MKIREIMKRTMAIGLAVAMLLQSQSVVTLAETVQTDAAETVVVDVGEETSVSGNGEEKKEEAEDINSDDPTIETETDEEEEASEESLIDENELEANMQFCESVESEIAADQAIDTTGFKDTYGLSYEELFTACPSYLDNMTAETIFNMMSDNAGEAWTEGLAQKDMAKAVYMMTQGSSYAINELLAEAGLTQSDYSKFQEEMAKRVIKNYLQTKPEEATYYNAMSTALSKISGTYSNAKDYTTLAGVIVEGTSDRLVQRDIEDILKKLDSNAEIMKYVKGFDQYCKMEATLVMLYSYDMGAVDTLIAAQKKVNPNNNDLLSGLQLVRIQMNDPYQYIMDKYVNDKVLSTISKELNTWLTEGVLGMTSMEAAVLNIVIQTAGLVYGIFNPTYEEIQYASIAFYYYSDATKSVKNYQKKLRNKNYKTSIPQDQILYEAAYSLRITCMQTFLDASKKCTSNKTLKKCLQTYSNMCSKGSMNYENYIKLCMNAASEDIKAGRLTITSTGVTKKTSDGTVIDASYDSKPSITAKLTAIMEKYPENYTWSSSWGGCSQCFGFARMVFSKLFGCEMPASYKGAKRYEYSNENNVNLVGQLEGSAVTASAVKDLFASARVGDIIQGCGSTWGQHTMVLIGVTDTGIQVYDCNSNNDNKVHTKSITWDRLATRYGSSATYANGISIYEADNYSEIYGDGDSVFFDDTANFTINEEGCITKYTGSQRVVMIPDTIGDITVTGIGENVFKNNARMVTVSIPDTVTYIGSSAFEGCTNLVGVTIPDGVTNVNSYTFYKCSNLKDVSFGENVTIIGNSAFSNCGSLESIEIPDSVTEIGTDAFANCESLANVKLSKNLMKLGSNAYDNCEKLEEIEIPKSLQEADKTPYYSNSRGPFGKCKNLRNVTFEKGTTRIAQNLFADCTGLEEIVIPETVTSINYNAFLNCSNLKSVTIGENVTTIGNSAFSNCSSLESIEIPDSMIEIEAQVFMNCSSMTEAYIADSVTSMGDSTFSGCVKLEKVHIPNCRINIMSNMFYNCNSLKEINLPDTLETIQQSAFYNCDSLTEMVLPGKVKEIGNSAFYDCDGLTKLVIPDSVTSIGNNAFNSCELLADVSLGTGLTAIPESCFANCPSIKEIVLPYRMKTLAAKAFNACTALTDVTIPRSVTTIGSQVFSYPAKMTIYGIAGTYAQTYADENSIQFVNKEVNATAASLDKKELTLNKGAVSRLVLSVTPSDFTDQVSWKSADQGIATIEEDGTLRALAIGTTTIKVIVGNVEAACKVTVVQPVTSVSISGNYKISMEGGDTLQLTAAAYPQNAFNKELKWESADPSVATVTKTGEVKALKKGSTRITATAMDGSGCNDYVDITVTNNVVYAQTVEEMQSPHPYEVNSSDKWIYTLKGATKTYITFDDKTEVEEDFDYIYVFDKNKKQTGKYTGKELAGKTIMVEGDTVILQLVADDAGVAYGFGVSRISDTGSAQNPTPAPTQTAAPSKDPAPTQNPAPSQNPAPTPSATPQQPASTSVYQYEKLADGTIRITSCQTKDVNLVIPDTIDGYTVTEIGTSAFANQTSIQTVKFPANLKQIGVKAFANCTGLLEVTLPDTIQGAGQLCFSGCTALKKAVLNKGRINIVYGMFENCTSLTEVVIPDTVENIAMYAFLNCRSLTHLNLPASMKSISVHAFEGAGVTTITYAGTKAQWQKVKKNLTGNGSFVTATVTDSTGVSFAVSGSNNGNQNPQQTVKKPGKVKITKAKNVKTKKLTVKWKKTSKAKGYQIQIASNKKFTKGRKTKTLSKTTYSFKKLKKNKYYYVRVRAYVYNSNHKKVYGSWSAVKKVKIKK